MIAYKKGLDAWVPVVLLDSSTGLPVSGKTYSSITATAAKGDRVTVSVTPASASDWVEAFAGSGYYWLRIPAAVVVVVGPLLYYVTCTGVFDYRGAVEVRNDFEAEHAALHSLVHP